MSTIIVQKDEAVLRKMAQKVNLQEIASPKIQKIIKEMKTALAEQDDGVAIAAPQIGVLLRIFVVSQKVEGLMNKKENVSDAEKAKTKDSVYINPEIKKMSKTKVQVEEGCLSIRYLYGKVARAEKATVEAWDETGKKFTRGGSGLLAQIFQHEIDHLNGMLFIDKARDVVEILPTQTKKGNLI